MFRFQEKQIIKDLDKKMVFVVGPRQVGKTWLSLKIAKNYGEIQYLNYDDFDDRKIITNRSWPSKIELIIFDELHKMSGWKNYLKGLYDTKKPGLKILVTGSARLDTFRQTGDSLAGRFFIHRLLPFTLSELESPVEDDFEFFLKTGGFPEPFLSRNIDESNRWRRHYIDGLIRNDILDFEKIHDFKSIQLVLELLRKKVGSPVSCSSIAEDVQISPVTVKKYIDIFEALYIIFKVKPYSKNISRSILKNPKIYFFDTGLVKGDEGVVLENHVAVELLKRQYAVCDYKGINTDLCYLRTKDKKEVDFCLVRENEIEFIVEVKLSDNKISKKLKYFTDRYGLKGVQLVKNIRNEYQVENISMRNIFKYFSKLSLY